MRSLVGFLVVASLVACQIQEPNLSTTEQALVTATPSAFTFPSTQVGNTSASTTIEIRPLGFLEESYAEVIAVNGCADFPISAPGLPAPVYRLCTLWDNCPMGQICDPYAFQNCLQWDYVTYQFTAAFRPNVAGTVGCSVSVVMSNETKIVSLSGTGTVPPIDIDVQPTSVAFGQVRRNTASTARTVTVRNLGGQTMTVSSVSVGAGFAITAGPTGSYSVPPNGSQNYSVTCNPTTLGAISGQLRVNSNDPATPVVNVALSCTGIDSNLDITPSPAQLPTTRVGEPVEHVLSLVNSGLATMTISSVALTGAGELAIVTAPPAGTVLNRGASTTARVAFDATTSGDASGSLVVTYDSGQTRTVEISARALATSMSLSPDGNVDLGPVCIDHSAQQAFTIVANDQGPFVVNQLGAPTAPFTLGAPTLPATVQGAGASSVAFTVTAAPTAAGVATSTIDVATDIPGAAPRTINLSVEGLTAGVSATPAVVDFGSTMLDTTTIGETVHLSNCATAPVTLANARIEGPHAADFAIVQAPASPQVAPTAKASFLIVASVKGVGVRSATFVVEASSADGDPPTLVTSELAVEGLGQGPGSTDDDPGRPSYYTCTATDAGGTAAWPLGIALALLIGRRRRR